MSYKTDFERFSADCVKSAANKYQQGRDYFESRFRRGSVPACSPGYISGKCDGGHKFAAPYLCGRETCPDCGRDGSPIHARRVLKWRPLVQQFDNLGYFVFTFPKEVRFLFKDPERLADFRYQLRRKLQRDGFKKGLARWHWFGDCTACAGAGCFMCELTGSGKDWNPHLNVFLDCGYLRPSDLEGFKDDFGGWARRYVTRQLQEELRKRDDIIERYGVAIANLDEVYTEIELLRNTLRKNNRTEYVINYSYTPHCNTEQMQGETINRLKYVLRSTFRIYDVEIKKLLYNFRNSVRWGFCGDVSADPAEPILCKSCAEKGLKHVVRWVRLKNYRRNFNTSYYGKGIYQLRGAGARSDLSGDLDAAPRVTLVANQNRKGIGRAVSWDKDPSRCERSKLPGSVPGAESTAGDCPY